MSFFEFMSFNVGWFITIPGILITVGIIILIIALILLLTDKNKKDVGNEVQTPEVAPAAPTEVQPATVQSVQPMASVENVQPVAPVAPVEIPAVAAAPMETPINEQVVVPTPEVTPVVTTPEVAPVAPTEVQPAPTLEIETPVVDTTPVENVQPVVEEPKVSIYGGVNPSSDIYKPNLEEVKPTTIYGGANPLENTAPIPKMEVNSIYNTPTEEVKVAEPIVNQAAPMETAVVNNGDTTTIPLTEKAVDEIEELEL